MKNLFSILSFLCFISLTYGQEIEFGGVFANSSSKDFKNSFGYTLGYDQVVKLKNRLGFSFSQYFYNTAYDDIYHPEYAPESLSIEEIVPQNKRYTIKANYAFNLVNNPKSKFYFGPEIGLNYFMIKEQRDRIANGTIEAGIFNSNYTINNRIGIGFLMEFQLDEVVAKNISTYLSINPEFTSFEKMGTTGSPDPFFIGWLNFKFGIRYKLIKSIIE